ncbi:MAG TPA: hypothetical protein PKA41_13355 [Verrucomicrobiota bacterium]|nr:hypothetical protein [Verrucomicrobiota bacterium]
MTRKPPIFFAVLVVLTATALHTALPHDTGVAHSHDDVPSANPLPFKREKRGPVKAPPRLAENVPVSGQGFWRFIAATNLMPVPAEALPSVVKAHSTLIVDAERDTVYWALKGVGWIGFSNGLRDSWIVKADASFTTNNVHGADILPRKGRLPLVAAADNEGHIVHLTDTTFRNPRTIIVPETGPYSTNKSFRPTDVAFVSEHRLFVTDGYARNFFMPATIEPFAHEEQFFGGRRMSRTAHGITYSPKEKSLLVSARPEGQIQHWSVDKEEYLSIEGLPEGTLVCDVDLWGDYALVACLENPRKAPGPLVIVNLKTKSIASFIKPKEELGYDFAQHIHDAAWYFHKNGKRTDVYLLFTSWNPGGVGALKLVNHPETK